MKPSRLLVLAATVVALSAAELRPVRVVVMVDQTGSTLATRVPALEVADFSGLFDLLVQNSGEIAVGAIRDRSNRPLLRCRVDQKPIRHAKEPSEKNVFIRQKLMRAYLSEKAKEDQQEAVWQDEAQKKLERFRQQLQDLLAAPLAGRTDIYGALLRADLFLAEPEDGWRQPTRRFAVFHSDGIDNVRAPSTTMRSGAAFLVVNGSASLGALNSLNPTRFESFNAAVRYVISHAKEE